MDSHLLTLKYIFKSKGRELPDSCSSIEKFFQSGIYFPQFVALIYDLDSIPNTAKSPKSLMAANVNNNAAFNFLTSKNNFFQNINSDFSNEKNQLNIINSIIEKEYFKSTNKDFLNKCNQYLKQNNDSITSFSEFNNIIGFLKLFAAYEKCSVYEILIQYIQSFDIPVIITKDSFNSSQNILMFQALIILEQLEESSKKIISKTQKNSNEKTEIKKKLSTCSNSIFEVLPSSKENNHSNDSEKTLSNSEEKISGNFNRKEFDDLQKLVNELKHQNEELNKKVKIQYEEQQKLNQESTDKDSKIKSMNNTIEKNKKQIENLTSNIEKVEQNKKILEETKNQQISKLNENLKNLQQNLEKQKSNLSTEIDNLKKQISDINNQKEVSEKNFKKQVSNLNQQKEITETELKEKINDLEKKLNDSQKSDSQSRPISQLLQPLWTNQDDELAQSAEPKLELKQNNETNLFAPHKKAPPPSTFWISLPGLMNYF